MYPIKVFDSVVYIYIRCDVASAKAKRDRRPVLYCRPSHLQTPQKVCNVADLPPGRSATLQTFPRKICNVAGGRFATLQNSPHSLQIFPRGTLQTFPRFLKFRIRFSDYKKEIRLKLYITQRYFRIICSIYNVVIPLHILKAQEIIRCFNDVKTFLWWLEIKISQNLDFIKSFR